MEYFVGGGKAEIKARPSPNQEREALPDLSARQTHRIRTFLKGQSLARERISNERQPRVAQGGSRQLVQFSPGADTSSARSFKPQRLFCLEQRAVPSTLVGTPVDRPDSAASLTVARDSTTSSSGMTELHNVPFPTVNGQSELLDVYMPTSPATAGGRPIIVAIHGGGWRRFNKTGYGSRVADAFVQNGYVVVAPDYVLSAPGSPSWPENLEDVQAAVRWVRTQRRDAWYQL